MCIFFSGETVHAVFKFSKGHINSTILRTSVLWGLRTLFSGKLIAQLITGGRGNLPSPQSMWTWGTGIKTLWVSLSPFQRLPPVPATAISSFSLVFASWLLLWCACHVWPLIPSSVPKWSLLTFPFEIELIFIFLEISNSSNAARARSGE